MMLPWRRNKPVNRGQALVEFALVLPVLILILLLAIDLGRAYFTQVGLRNAAREASIYAGYHPLEGCAGGTGYSGVRYTIAKELGLGSPPNASLVGCGSGGDVQVVTTGPHATGCFSFVAPNTYAACTGSGPWDPTLTLVYRVELRTNFEPAVPFVGFLTGHGFGNPVPITVVNSAPVLANYGG